LLKYGIIFCIIFSIAQYVANYLFCGAIKEMYKQESYIDDDEELSHLMGYRIAVGRAYRDTLRNIAFCWAVFFAIVIIYLFTGITI